MNRLTTTNNCVLINIIMFDILQNVHYYFVNIVHTILLII
jgi:hypothetical protein